MSVRLLTWFGVLGPPLTWALQHVAGFALTQATCLRGGEDVHMRGATIVLTALAALLVLAAEGASLSAWRATRDAGEEPPGSRIHFLTVIGLTLGPLFLAIVLMTGLGAVSLPRCAQG